MLLYISALILAIVVLGAHISGLDGLYFTYAWYDIMMHALGGASIALFLSALLKSYRSGAFFSRRSIMVGVIIIGIVWEVFEMYYELTGYPLWSKLYYIDTVKDLIDDVIGGAIVVWIVGRLSKAPDLGR